MIMRGESYISWMNRINQQSELADLKNIRAQEIQLMKFCQGLNKTDWLYEKLMELEVPSWARAQEIIKKHAQSMARKAVLVDSAPKTAQGQVLNQMSGKSRARPTSQERNLTQTPGGGTKPRLSQLPKATRGGKAREGARAGQGSAGNVTRL